MAPKSLSAKPAFGSKAKSTSSATKIKQELLRSRKPAVSLHVKKTHNLKKIKQVLLKDCKTAASSSTKENHKKIKQELLKGRKRASSSSAKENHDAQLKKLEAENDALRKTLAVKERVMTMIPRPDKGVAGNGFNLQEAMGLADDPETYALLRRSVRDLAAKAGIDCAVLWYRQPKDLISKIIGAARQRHTYFKKFPHGWAIEEFLKSNLKNKRAYARKRGYLGDQTNRGVESGEENKLGDDGDEAASNPDSEQGAGSNRASDDLNGDDDGQGGNDSLDRAARAGDYGRHNDDQDGDNYLDRASDYERHDDDQDGDDDLDRASDYGYEDIYMGEDDAGLEYYVDEDGGEVWEE